MPAGIHCTGIILKRTDTGEADRVVTVLTKERGKVVCIAKGCRKITSSKLSALEPGTICHLYLIETKGMPLVTQARVDVESGMLRTSLLTVRRLFEVLEILDAIIPDGEQDEHIYALAVRMISSLHTESHHEIRPLLHTVLVSLGFADEASLDPAKPVKELVEELTQTRLHAYAYLHAH